MVKGLEIFREHFRDYADRYVLIGGAACDIAMTGAGLEFRATEDLDIVLYVETLDAAFVRVFWEFVRAGGYEVQESQPARSISTASRSPPTRTILSCWSCSRGRRCATGCRRWPPHTITA